MELMRFGRAVVVVFVAGCSAAAATPTTARPGTAAAQTVPVTAATVLPEPTVAPISATAAPTTAPAMMAPTAEPTAVAVTTSDAATGATVTTSGVAPGAAATTSDAATAARDAGADPPCDGTVRPDPLPAPGTPRAQDFFRSFRTPLDPAPLYDPPGQRRVGLQAGHWLTEDVPPELGRLQGGSVGGGKQEWEVNLDMAQRTAALLEAAGVQVDVLPATVPPRYRANAFIALHADGDPAGLAHGFKVARPGFSSLPDVDDRLVETLNQVYAADTELPRDDEHISLRMRYYYAFNSRRYCHAVAPGVPQAIIEMGYLTSAVDRAYLIGDPDKLARGLADGIETFLNTLP